MKRAIAYIVIGVLGMAGVSYVLKGFIDEISTPMFITVHIAGIIFYGLVFYNGLTRLKNCQGSRR